MPVQFARRNETPARLRFLFKSSDVQERDESINRRATSIYRLTAYIYQRLIIVRTWYTMILGIRISTTAFDICSVHEEIFLSKSRTRQERGLFV